MSSTGIGKLWFTRPLGGGAKNLVPTGEGRGVAQKEAVEVTPTIEALHRRFAGVVYDKCLRILADQAAAEDAVQETFFKAHRALGRYQGPDGHLPWLYRIATNTCLNMLRTRRRKWAQLIDSADDQAGRAIDGERALLGRRLLQSLLGSCDERTLTIVVAHYIDEMSQGEIAAQLGISRRAVVKRLTTLRRRAEQLRVEGGQRTRE